MTYEIMEISQELGAMISKGATEEELRDHVRANGILSMAKHAEQLVAQGITTREEVQRVLEFGGI